MSIPGGTVHDLPSDLRSELTAHPDALAAWHDITPLARNEFICWVDDAKKDVPGHHAQVRDGVEIRPSLRRVS